MALCAPYLTALFMAVHHLTVG